MPYVMWVVGYLVTGSILAALICRSIHNAKSRDKAGINSRLEA